MSDEREESLVSMIETLEKIGFQVMVFDEPDEGSGSNGSVVMVPKPEPPPKAISFADMMGKTHEAMKRRYAKEMPCRRLELVILGETDLLCNCMLDHGSCQFPHESQCEREARYLLEGDPICRECLPL